MVISKLKQFMPGMSSKKLQDNNGNNFKNEISKTTSEPKDKREESTELLKKPDSVARPQAKPIQEISKFTPITKTQDLESSVILDKAGAKKILTKFSLDESKVDAFTCKDGNHLAVFCGDKNAAINNGLRSLLGSWFGLRKLFTGFDTRVALKYTAGGGVIDLVDKNETKMDKAQLAQGVKSGEFKLVYIYQSGDGVEKTTEQKFDKEPLAIAVLHDYSIMLEQIEERFNSKFPDKAIQQKLQFQAEFKKLKENKSLQNIYACDTILVNPKKKDKITGEKINSICINVAECMPARTTLIFPRYIAGALTTEAQSKNKRYSSIDWRHLENKENKWDYVQKPITIIRDLDHGSDPIPEGFLTVNQFHNMAKVKDLKSMDPASVTKVLEAQEFNKTALVDYDNAVKPGYNEEKTKESEKSTEKTK